MNDQIGLKKGFEERLDIVAKNIINNETLGILVSRGIDACNMIYTAGTKFWRGSGEQNTEV